MKNINRGKVVNRRQLRLDREAQEKAFNIAHGIKVYEGKVKPHKPRKTRIAITCLLLVLFVGCSAWRLRTPEFKTGPQTNSIGEVYYPTNK
jgi:hypothetical protein